VPYVRLPFLLIPILFKPVCSDRSERILMSALMPPSRRTPEKFIESPLTSINNIGLFAAY